MFPDLNEDPGAGNLNLRAYMGSIVGPLRLAHSRRSVKVVNRAQAVPLVNQPSGIEVAYFEVWLPQSSIAALPGGGAFLSFSGDESAGQNGFQLLLNATQRYRGMCLGADRLYALAVADATGAALAIDVSVVVASVVF